MSAVGGRLIGSGFVPGTKAEREAKRLAKDHRSFERDIGEALADLDANGPDERDDEIPGFAGVVFKRRVRCRDSNKGKRGGYRPVYGVFDAGIAVLAVYLKNDLSDISAEDLTDALKKMQATVQRISQNPECAPSVLAEMKSD